MKNIRIAALIIILISLIICSFFYFTRQNKLNKIDSFEQYMAIITGPHPDIAIINEGIVGDPIFRATLDYKPHNSPEVIALTNVILDNSGLYKYNVTIKINCYWTVYQNYGMDWAKKEMADLIWEKAGDDLIRSLPLEEIDGIFRSENPKLIKEITDADKINYIKEHKIINKLMIYRLTRYYIQH